MTILEVLPTLTVPDGDENVVKIALPSAGIAEDGTHLRGYADPEFIEQYFGLTGKQVPLSEVEYQMLLDASDEPWRQTWQMWRAEGRI